VGIPAFQCPDDCPSPGLKPEVVDAAVGAATDDINQVIAGLEAQRRRQETKATEAQELLQQVQRLYQEVSEKQQHCRTGIAAATSWRCRARSLKPKGNCSGHSPVATRPHDSASCPASNECPDSTARHLPPPPPKPKLVSTARAIASVFPS